MAVLSFDVDAESPILAQGRRYADHAMVMTHQAYGPQVGVPRLLRAARRLRDQGHVLRPRPDRRPLPADRRADRSPPATRSATTPTAIAARSTSGRGGRARGLRARARGARPRSASSPRATGRALWEASWDTPSLVAEYGLEYDSTLMDDDKPYLLETPQGHDRRAPAALEPRRLGAVRLPAAAADRRATSSRPRRCSTCGPTSSTRCAATAACSCSPTTRSCPGARGGWRRCASSIEHALGRGDVEFVTAAEVAARVREDPEATRRTLRPVEVDATIYPEL